MRLILIIISAIIVDEICWRLILRSVKGYARMEERIYDMSKYKNNDHRVDKQTVYKVDGDFNGNIKGDNVTVILMGNGDFNGNISSKDGEVVLLNGNIRGDVKADKILCPTKPNASDKEVGGNYRNCQSYKPVNRHNDDSTAKHNPTKDGKSPKLQVETLWSCEIPQSASSYERIDFIYDGDKCANRYKSLALANVTCPHCRKSFFKNLRVVTTVVDGEVSNTEIQNYGGYILD